uniref:Uncharacterized protein n=1 Tax=Anguilla anguilla TaxID=7936 RepID=A0A0E9XSH6_ANGAN
MKMGRIRRKITRRYTSMASAIDILGTRVVPGIEAWVELQ